MRLRLSVVAFCLLGVASARADWLDDLWSDEAVAENGNPSITLRAHDADVVVPAAILDAAYSQGSTSRDVVLAILRRYGPCSDLLDLNRTHEHLTVRLFVQREVPHEDSVVANQDAVIAWARRGGEEKPGMPRITKAFEVASGFERVVLRYTPGLRNARCVAVEPTS
ncbi:hypothetical protein [Benzoatithermus flavus]|uniref:Uncharacterized protein n=1 Tax=Benzoatithermus flavus TaxID=3108223 RepID=A0ABU8XRT9_9PROT